MASVSSADKNVRKALKKLKEIAELKTRTNRNAEEDEKLQKEDFYRRILDPSYRTEEEKEQERLRTEMLQKEKEATKRRQYKRHEEKQKKKAESEKKRQEEDMKRHAEAKAQQKEWEEARAKRKEWEKSWEKTREKAWEEARVKDADTDPLETEYISLLRENKNDNSKTFRKMSRKYHPDKNLDRQKWAEEMQKRLLTIRDKCEI
jgi:hypothetical protein